MTRRTVLLTEANVQEYSGTVLNPNGERIIDVVSGDAAGYYPALLGPAKEIGDIVLVRFTFGNFAPVGQKFKLAGLSIIDPNVAQFFEGDSVTSGFQVIKKAPPAFPIRRIAISLQFLGDDWLVLGKTQGVEAFFLEV